MPTFLSDPATTLYLVGILLSMVLGAFWYRQRTRPTLIAFLCLVGLTLALFASDYFVESPREAATRKVMLMADAASIPDGDRFVEYISKQFNYNGAGRERIRDSNIWKVIKQYHARVAVWGFGKDDFQMISDNEVEIGFYAKGQSATEQGAVLRRIVTRFIRDPDGEFRLKSMKFYALENGGRNEEPVPGFP